LDDFAGVLDVLASGDLSLEGRLTVASNLTLFATATSGERRVTCVYKPVSGESPLWDFPDGSLAGREVAAFEISAAAGWHVVPPTVMRADGPFGPGMCQLWLEQDDRQRWVDVVPPREVPAGWLPVLQAVDGDGDPVILVHADSAALRKLAVFDVVVNNADRKGGHVLTTGNDVLTSHKDVLTSHKDVLTSQIGRLAPAVGVDHGVCFHTEPKLRTVLWGWSGSPLTAAEREELSHLRSLLTGKLTPRLHELITVDEVDAIGRRIDALLERGMLPEPTGRMPVPWPVF
jgi:uncharacterized repeat protein (TIGR03843 family)